jgi:putative transposase
MTAISRAYKTQLDPTQAQVAAFEHQSDVVRFVWNWALGKRQEHYKATGKHLKGRELIAEFRRVRAEVWPWTVGASSRAEETAVRNLDKAFDNFFAKRGKYPRFKSRKNGVVSFTYWGLKQEHVSERGVRLQGIGWVRTHERGYLPTEGVKVNSATVSERAGKWYVSLQVEEEREIAPATGEAVGVDVGISSLAVVSDGRRYENPKALRGAQRKLRRLNKQLARQEKGSGRREDTKHALAREYARIADLRSAAAHAASADIVAGTPRAVVIEDLNVAGMVKNRHLAQAVSDAGMAELHRQLRYKVPWAGGEVVEAGRFFPSSKTCSSCGYVNGGLTLSDRVFVCPECGYTVDRDLNAAVNLSKLAPGSGESLNARGEARPEPSRGVVETSAKREPVSAQGVQ